MPKPPSTTADESDIRSPARGRDHGKYVIIALVAVGLVGAGGGWLYHRQMQRRAIAFWGAEAAALILSAPQVDVLQLEADAKTDPANREVVAWAGRRWRVITQADASHAPGIAHLRHRLVQDTSFDWSTAPDNENSNWQYALRFSDDGKRATLLFDLDRQHAGLAETGATASLAPIGNALKTLLPGFLGKSRQ